MIGGGEPSYSVPLIWYSASIAAPAPRMLPVCGKPLIGTALALNVTVGTANAALGIASKARPRTARQMDALRISFLSLSFDRQVRLDPGSSGAIAGPATSRSSAGAGEHGDFL